ncbi:23463_t:CDS:2, partial [Dentiscutata erythropus]
MDFLTIPVSVGDFVLQKLSENILGNWNKNSSSTESSDESSSLEFQSAPPINEIVEDDNNYIQQSFNIIEVNDNNNTQQSSSETIIEDNNNTHQFLSETIIMILINLQVIQTLASTNPSYPQDSVTEHTIISIDNNNTNSTSDTNKPPSTKSTSIQNTSTNPNTNRKRPRNLSNISPFATASNKATKAVLGNTSTPIRIQA